MSQKADLQISSSGSPTTHPTYHAPRSEELVNAHFNHEDLHRGRKRSGEPLQAPDVKRYCVETLSGLRRAESPPHPSSAEVEPHFGEVVSILEQQIVLFAGDQSEFAHQEPEQWEHVAGPRAIAHRPLLPQRQQRPVAAAGAGAAFSVVVARAVAQPTVVVNVRAPAPPPQRPRPTFVPVACFISFLHVFSDIMKTFEPLGPVCDILNIALHNIAGRGWTLHTLAGDFLLTTLPQMAGNFVLRASGLIQASRERVAEYAAGVSIERSYDPFNGLWELVDNNYCPECGGRHEVPLFLGKNPDHVSNTYWRRGPLYFRIVVILPDGGRVYSLPLYITKQ